MLLKRYRNGLLEAIQRAGLDPALFEPSEKVIEGRHTFALRLRGSPLFFAVRTNPGDAHTFDCIFVPLAPDYAEAGPFPENDYDSFKNLLDSFQYWLKHSAAEYLADQTAEDRWAAIFPQDASSALAATVPADDSRFSLAEQRRIADAMHTAVNTLTSQGAFTSEQLSVISAKVDHLLEASSTLGRKDWLTLTMGTMMAIAFEAGLNPVLSRQVFRVIGAALSWLGTHYPTLPPVGF